MSRTKKSNLSIIEHYSLTQTYLPLLYTHSKQEYLTKKDPEAFFSTHTWSQLFPPRSISDLALSKQRQKQLTIWFQTLYQFYHLSLNASHPTTRPSPQLTRTTQPSRQNINNIPSKLLLLHGSSGIGKSASIDLLCKEFHFDPLFFSHDLPSIQAQQERYFNQRLNGSYGTVIPSYYNPSIDIGALNLPPAVFSLAKFILSTLNTSTRTLITSYNRDSERIIDKKRELTPKNAKYSPFDEFDDFNQDNNIDQTSQNTPQLFPIRVIPALSLEEDPECLPWIFSLLGYIGSHPTAAPLIVLTTTEYEGDASSFFLFDQLKMRCKACIIAIKNVTDIKLVESLKSVLSQARELLWERYCQFIKSIIEPIRILAEQCKGQLEQIQQTTVIDDDTIDTETSGILSQLNSHQITIKSQLNELNSKLHILKDHYYSIKTQLVPNLFFLPPLISTLYRIITDPNGSIDSLSKDNSSKTMLTALLGERRDVLNALDSMIINNIITISHGDLRFGIFALQMNYLDFIHTRRPSAAPTTIDSPPAKNRQKSPKTSHTPLTSIIQSLFKKNKDQCVSVFHLVGKILSFHKGSRLNVATEIGQTAPLQKTSRSKNVQKQQQITNDVLERFFSQSGVDREGSDDDYDDDDDDDVGRGINLPYQDDDEDNDKAKNNTPKHHSRSNPFVLAPDSDGHDIQIDHSLTTTTQSNSTSPHTKSQSHNIFNDSHLFGTPPALPFSELEMAAVDNAEIILTLHHNYLYRLPNYTTPPPSPLSSSLSNQSSISLTHVGKKASNSDNNNSSDYFTNSISSQLVRSQDQSLSPLIPSTNPSLTPPPPLFWPQSQPTPCLQRLKPRKGVISPQSTPAISHRDSLPNSQPTQRTSSTQYTQRSTPSTQHSLEHPYHNYLIPYHRHPITLLSNISNAFSLSYHLHTGFQTVSRSLYLQATYKSLSTNGNIGSNLVPVSNTSIMVELPLAISSYTFHHLAYYHPYYIQKYLNQQPISFSKGAPMTYLPFFNYIDKTQWLKRDVFISMLNQVPFSPQRALLRSSSLPFTSNQAPKYHNNNNLTPVKTFIDLLQPMLSLLREKMEHSIGFFIKKNTAMIIRQNKINAKIDFMTPPPPIIPFPKINPHKTLTPTHNNNFTPQSPSTSSLFPPSHAFLPSLSFQLFAQGQTFNDLYSYIPLITQGLFQIQPELDLPPVKISRILALSSDPNVVEFPCGLYDSEMNFHTDDRLYGSDLDQINIDPKNTTNCEQNNKVTIDLYFSGSLSVLNTYPLPFLLFLQYLLHLDPYIRDKFHSYGNFNKSSQNRDNDGDGDSDDDTGDGGENHTEDSSESTQFTSSKLSKFQKLLFQTPLSSLPFELPSISDPTPNSDVSIKQGDFDNQNTIFMALLKFKKSLHFSPIVHYQNLSNYYTMQLNHRQLSQSLNKPSFQPHLSQSQPQSQSQTQSQFVNNSLCLTPLPPTRTQEKANLDSSLYSNPLVSTYRVYLQILKHLLDNLLPFFLTGTSPFQNAFTKLKTATNVNTTSTQSVQNQVMIINSSTTSQNIKILGDIFNQFLEHNNDWSVSSSEIDKMYRDNIGRGMTIDFDQDNDHNDNFQSRNNDSNKFTLSQNSQTSQTQSTINAMTSSLSHQSFVEDDEYDPFAD